MLRPFGPIAAVRMELPSDPSLVDEVVESATRLTFGQRLQMHEDFTIVLRELLKNAVVHGNRCDRARKVRLSIDQLNGGAIRITVEDEGIGFDYGHLALEPCPKAKCGSTSGYTVITSLTTRLDFNESGNRVSACLVWRERGVFRDQGGIQGRAAGSHREEGHEQCG